MADDLRIAYRPPGPVGAAFIASKSPTRLIMGPVGAGKTSVVLMDFIYKAMRQAPSPRDGVRRFKFCVVRDTYRQLWKTTIPSWWHWVPKEVGKWEGSDGAPARHEITFDAGFGPIKLIAEFIAIGENKVEDVLRGYEPTAFYLNEADLLAYEVYVYARTRVGRYPSMDDGGPSWAGISLDMNAPDFDNWTVTELIEKPFEGFEFFRQPSGLSPQAENLANLRPGYYAGQMAGQPEWMIRRMVRSEFGFSRDGKPIYPEFNDALHVAAEDLAPAPGLPLLIGLDAGGTPAGVICQRPPTGQWRALDEIVVEADGVMGPNRFGDALNRVLKERYEGFEAAGWADPSAAYGADSQADEKNWIQAVRAKTEIDIRAAPSNAPSLRWDAVRGPLTRMIDGRLPGLVISPRCKMLRRGFNHRYRFRRLQMAEHRYDDRADKNEASHVHDALQYVMLGGGEHAAVMSRGERRNDARRQTQAIDEDHPEGGFGGGGRRRRSQSHDYQAEAID